jgi:hypothetical protein
MPTLTEKVQPKTVDIVSYFKELADRTDLADPTVRLGIAQKTQEEALLSLLVHDPDSKVKDAALQNAAAPLALLRQHAASSPRAVAHNPNCPLDLLLTMPDDIVPWEARDRIVNAKVDKIGPLKKQLGAIRDCEFFVACHLRDLWSETDFSAADWILIAGAFDDLDSDSLRAFLNNDTVPKQFVLSCAQSEFPAVRAAAIRDKRVPAEFLRELQKIEKYAQVNAALERRFDQIAREAAAQKHATKSRAKPSKRPGRGAGGIPAAG